VSGGTRRRSDTGELARAHHDRAVPFAPGNMQSVTAGHRSPRVYGQLARLLAAGLVDDRPDLGAYPEAVASWATAEAQAALLRRHLAKVGTLDDEDVPREGLLKWLTKFETTAAAARAALGLDPRSEAALRRERAAAAVLTVDLVGLAERGAAALAAQERAGAQGPPDLAGEVLATVAAGGARAQLEAAAHDAPDGGQFRNQETDDSEEDR
jgi:hypothetical protein